MHQLVAPLVAAGDEDTAQLLCQDILRASSRTASGGDAYSVATSLLVRLGNLLTPAAVEVGGGLGVDIDGGGGWTFDTDVPTPPEKHKNSPRRSASPSGPTAWWRSGPRTPLHCTAT